MDGMGIALAFALTSVPAFLVARSLQRTSDPSRAAVNHALARMMRWVGAALFAGAVAMLWAGSDATRVLAVALAMALAVNGLAVAMLVTVLRRRRGPGPE
jgi:hypothetical protein